MFFLLPLLYRNFDDQLSSIFHRFCYFMHVEIHQVSRLVFDNYQRCPVPLNSPINRTGHELTRHNFNLGRNITVDIPFSGAREVTDKIKINQPPYHSQSVLKGPGAHSLKYSKLNQAYHSKPQRASAATDPERHGFSRVFFFLPRFFLFLGPAAVINENKVWTRSESSPTWWHSLLSPNNWKWNWQSKLTNKLP